MKTTYDLKYFSNSSQPGLIAALRLYSRNIEPSLKTDTREIIHWLDYCNQRYEDPFYILGFYQDRNLIGFAELAYFKQEQVVIVDYIVIDRPYRGNDTFYVFMQKVREFLTVEDLAVKYVVAEIGYSQESKEPADKTKLLVRLLKMAQFGVVKCSYYLPRLGADNFESEMKGVLMIYSTTETTHIRKETFFQIVKAIYFKYYQRWYNEFLTSDQMIEYGRGLHNLVAKLEEELKNKNVIEINGYPHLNPWQGESLKTLVRSRTIRSITGAALLAVCFVAVTGVYLFLRTKFAIDATALGMIFYASLFMVIFLFSLIFERKSSVFSKLVEKIIDKF